MRGGFSQDTHSWIDLIRQPAMSEHGDLW